MIYTMIGPDIMTECRTETGIGTERVIIGAC